MVVLSNTFHLLQAKNAIKSALIKKEVPDAEIPTPTAVEEVVPADDTAASEVTENTSVNLEVPSSTEHPDPTPQDDQAEAVLPPAPDTSVVESSEGVGAADELPETVPGNPFDDGKESDKATESDENIEDILMCATGDPYTSDHLDDVSDDEHLQNLLLKSSLVKPPKETLQPSSVVHPVPSPKVVEQVSEPEPAQTKGLDYYQTFSVPPPVLSESAIYNRLWRVFQAKANGLQELDERWVNAWKDVKGGRVELYSMFEKTGYSVERGVQSLKMCLECFGSRLSHEAVALTKISLRLLIFSSILSAGQVCEALQSDHRKNFRRDLGGGGWVVNRCRHGKTGFHIVPLLYYRQFKKNILESFHFIYIYS